VRDEKGNEIEDASCVADLMAVEPELSSQRERSEIRQHHAPSSGLEEDLGAVGDDVFAFFERDVALRFKRLARSASARRSSREVSFVPFLLGLSFPSLCIDLRLRRDLRSSALRLSQA